MVSDPSPEQIALDVGKVFTPAVPVSDRALFIGRIEEIRRLVDAINQRGQHAAIFGNRGVGKTSLANIIASKLTANVPIVAPHVTCNATDDFKSLWRAVLSNITLIEKKRQAGFQKLTLFEETRSAADVIGDKVTPDDLRRLFALIGDDKLLIIVLDEFDRLKQTARRAIADTIKTFADHSVPATIIVVGVAETIDDLIAEHQSIERVLVQVEMPLMTGEDLIEILHMGTARLNMTIGEDAARFIASLSQGLPYYAHLLALHAARTTLDRNQREITMPYVSEAIDKAVSDSHASLKSDFRKAVTSPQQANIFGQVLLACALTKTDEWGYFSAADVRAPLSRIRRKNCDIPSFAKHLKRFCGSDRGSVLEMTGAKHKLRYRFSNALMPPLILMKGFVEQRITAHEVEEIQAS
jgi:Cdc6-like AAA superfamily ATPase